MINKVSQNLHAELMLRLLGKEKGTSGSIEGGLEVLRGFLVNAGIKPDQFVFYDGSGSVARGPGDAGSDRADAALLPQQPWGQSLRRHAAGCGNRWLAGRPLPQHAGGEASSVPRPDRYRMCTRCPDMPPRSRAITSLSR